MNACMKDFAENSHADLKWPEEAAAAEKPAGMEEGGADAGMEAAGDAAEGGEGEAAAAEGEAAAASAPASGPALKDWGEFAAVTDIPKLLVALAFCHNIFFDVVKWEIMWHEYEGDASKDTDFGAAATLMAAYLSKELASAEEVECFAPANVSEEDMADITACSEAKDKGAALIFPGMFDGFAEQGTAEGGYYKKDGGYTKVMYKMKHKGLKPAGNLIVMYRPFFTVEKIEDVDGKDYKLVTLTPYSEHLFADLSDYYSKIKDGVAVVGAVAGAAKTAAEGDKGMEDKPEEGAGDKPEGEGM